MKEKRTPIASNMYLPNNSGMASHPEAINSFVPYTGANANVDLGAINKILAHSLETAGNITVSSDIVKSVGNLSIQAAAGWVIVDGNLQVTGAIFSASPVKCLEAVKINYEPAGTNYITLTTESDGDLTIDSNKASYDVDFGDGNLTTTGTVDGARVNAKLLVVTAADGVPVYVSTGADQPYSATTRNTDGTRYRTINSEGTTDQCSTIGLWTSANGGSQNAITELTTIQPTVASHAAEFSIKVRKADATFSEILYMYGADASAKFNGALDILGLTNVKGGVLIESGVNINFGNFYEATIKYAGGTGHWEFNPRNVGGSRDGYLLYDWHVGNDLEVVNDLNVGGDILQADNKIHKFGTTNTDLQIYSDGTNGKINTTGTLDITTTTLDVTGAITSSTTITGEELIGNNAADLYIRQPESNKDIFVTVNDGGVIKTAMFFDGSLNNVQIPGKLRHLGDTDTSLSFTDDKIDLNAGGVKFLTLDVNTELATFDVNGEGVGFKVNSAAGTSIFVNGGNGRVGMGNAAPTSKLNVTGAISSSTATLTASSDDYDVSGVNTLFITTAGGAVILGGLKGGVAGQYLYIARKDATNDFTIEHLEGVGTQDMYMHEGTDETIDSWGGFTFICDGSDWYDCSHAKHV